MNKAELKFKDKCVTRGGLLLFPKQMAVEFIIECQTEKN